jgi:hypothetical protein
MTTCAHSRLTLRTLLKFRRCAEGSIARKRTCWKLRSRAPEGPPSDGPRAIPHRPCSTTPVKSQPNKANRIRRLFHLPDYGLGPTRDSGLYLDGVVSNQLLSFYSFYGQSTTIFLAYADAPRGCAGSKRRASRQPKRPERRKREWHGRGRDGTSFRSATPLCRASDVWEFCLA